MSPIIIFAITTSTNRKSECNCFLLHISDRVYACNYRAIIRELHN